MQGMADLYRVKVDLLECLSKCTIKPFCEVSYCNTGDSSSTIWKDISPNYCGTEIDLSSITVIPYCNMLLFAVSFCHY